MSNTLHFPVPCHWFIEDLRCDGDNNNSFVNDDEDSYDNDIKMNETCKCISDIVYNYLQITLKSGNLFHFLNFSIYLKKKQLLAIRNGKIYPF